MTTAAERFALGMSNPLRASVMYPPDRSLFAPYRVAATEEAVRASLAAARSPVVLYAHVPFCETRCSYCGYATLPFQGDEALDACVEGLVAELRSVSRALLRGTVVDGFDIGGGTPGLLSARHVERLVETVARSFPLAPAFEVSFETTPSLAATDPAKWAAIRSAGVSRVSVGLQTSSRPVLRRLGRRQDEGVPRRALESLRSAGFPVVNTDVMFGLPGEDPRDWEATLDEVVSLEPDVVTAYDTVYKSRPIAARQAPAPAAVGALYDAAFARLTGAGYAARYGSVNFSRVPGRLGTSRALEGRLLHGRAYVGTGLYASSLTGTTWRFNPATFDGWLAATRSGRLAASDLYALPEAHVRAKAVLLALTYGFLSRERFGEGDARHAETVRFLLGRGLLREAPDGVELVPGAFTSIPGIRAAFCPDEALAALQLPVLRAGRRLPAVA